MGVSTSTSSRSEVKLVVEIFLFSLMVRIILSPIQGNIIDLSTFASWFQNVAENGIHSLYETWCDYPPFNAYIFWVFGTLAKYLSLFGTSAIIYVLKLPANIFDVATSTLIYLFLRKRTDFKKSLFATSLYLFNPATIFNTSIWGQYDAVYTFFLVLSLIFVIGSKPNLSAVIYAIAVLTKPQSIALAPLIIYLIFKKYGWEKVVTSIFAMAATILIVILPFNWDNPVTFLFNIYSAGYGGYQFTTVNAFNIWAFFGFWKPDTQSFGFLNFFIIGWVLFACSAIFSIIVLHKRFKASGEISILFSSFLLLFSFFMLLTRIHERYLFPAISILIMMFPFSKKMRPFLYILSFTYLMNQAYVMYFLNTNQFIPSGDPFALTMSLINSIMFVYVFTLAWRELRIKYSHAPTHERVLRDHKRARAVKADTDKAHEMAIKSGVRPRAEAETAEECQYYLDRGVRDFCIGWDTSIIAGYCTHEGMKLRNMLKI